MSPELISAMAVLKGAVAREEMSIRLYSRALDAFENPEARKVLSFLRAEEMTHLKKLKQALEQKPEQVIGSPGAEAEYTQVKAAAPASLSEAKTPGQIVAFAIRHEEKSIEYFSRYVDAFRGTALGDLFDLLRREERLHREKLLSAFSQYL